MSSIVLLRKKQQLVLSNMKQLIKYLQQLELSMHHKLTREMLDKLSFCQNKSAFPLVYTAIAATLL